MGVQGCTRDLASRSERDARTELGRRLTEQFSRTFSVLPSVQSSKGQTKPEVLLKLLMHSGLNEKIEPEVWGWPRPFLRLYAQVKV